MTALREGYISWMRGLAGVRNDPTSPVAPDFDAEAHIKQTLLKTLSFNLDPSTTSATNAALRHCFYAYNNMTVKGISYVPDAAAVTDNSNYANITVYKGAGNAAAATQVAQISLTPDTATNMVAGTPYAATLTAANVNVDAGQTLAVEIGKQGTGLAVPKGSLVVHYEER